MKKALAFLLSVLLLLATVPAGVLSIAAADGSGVIESTNFDDGELHGWASSSTISVEDGALKFECTKDWANVYKYANGMKANTDYLYTFKAKANMNKNMNIKINDNWAKDTARETVDLTTTWQEFSVVVNSGDCTGPILMFSANEPASTGLVYYIDDIVIAEYAGDEPEVPDQPETPADGNRIVNGDFETGDASGWETWQSTSISADAAKDGAYGAHLVGNGSWGGMLNQTVSVEAGKQYKLSFWINVNNNGVNLQVKDGSGKAIDGAGGWFDTNKKDHLVEWTFTATDSSVLINFCGGGNGVAEDVYVDNFSMVCLSNGGDEPDAPAGPSDDGYIVNGDFETGDIAPWDNLWGSCPTAEVIEGGKDSAYALNVVSKQWCHVRQTGIAVEANTDYKITVWAKNANNMCLLVKDGNDTTDIANVGVNAGAEWTQFTVEFNSGSFTSIIFSLMGGEGTDQYGVFDNIVMEKVGGGETPDEPVLPDEPVIPDVPSDAPLNATFDGGETDGISSTSNISVADGVLQFNVTKDWGNVYTELAVEANTDYEVSFRAKSKLGKNFWVKFHKADWTGDVCQADVSIGTDWKDYTFTLNSGDNTYVYLLVQFAGYASDGETVWFDYITVKKAGGDEPDQPIDPDVPVDGNLIINGDFETGDASGWEAWQSTSISTDAAKDGFYGAHLVGTGNWGGLLNQTMTVEAGKEYKLSFWINVLSTGVNVQVKDGSGKSIEGAGGWFDTKKKDYLVEWTFTATDNSVLINFCGSGSAPEDAYVDNFSLVCLSNGGDKPDEPVVDSDIVNGSFENGSEGWELRSSASITDEDAHTGDYSLKLDSPTMWSAAAVQTVAVKPNTEYVIKVWTLRVSGSGAFNLFMMDPADYRNLEVVEGQNWFNTKDVDWTEHTIVINTGAASEIVLRWSSETSNAGILLVDDMTITEKNAPANNNCIVNGDFETGDTTGWESWQSTVVSEEAAKNGKYGAHLMGNGGWGGLLNQTFAVEEGETYIITLWACVNSAGVNLQIRDADKVEGECDLTYLDSNELSGWTKRTFTVVANSDEITLIFCGSGTGKAEDAYIDDIVVTKKGETPAVDDTYPIKNAGFESGELTPWINLWDSCFYSIETGGYKGSNYALNFEATGQWRQIRQDRIPVEPNTDYVLVGYVKNPLNVNIVVKTGDDSAIINEVAIANNYSGKWIRAAVEFNSGNQTEVCALLIAREYSASAIFDDIQLYKKGEEPTDVENDDVATEGPMHLDAYGVAINRPASPEVNRIQNGSFEDAEGGQWQSVISDTLYVVDDETAPDGNKTLFFNTSDVTENNKVIFYLDVQPNTDYVFSAWVKGAYISADNRFNATFGVTDWKDNFCVYADDLFSNKTRQIVPTAWDNQWHLRSVQFNTGENTRIGIGFAGAESQMWIDDIALYTVDNGVKYDTAKQDAVILPTILEENKGGCSDEHNRIANATMDSAAAQEFWASAEGFGNGFISFPENEYEYGTSMKYVGDEDSCSTHAIKWLELKPNTKYTFSVDVRVVQSGGGRLALLDGKMLHCCEFLTIDFSQRLYGVDWTNITIEFDSVAFDRIGIAIVDGGGEALIDNMRLFESEYRIEGGIVDEYVDPPYDFGDPDESTDSSTIDFTDIGNRISYSTSQQVWKQNGITVINNQGASTSNVGDYGGDGDPARFYKNSNVTILYPNIAKIVIECGNLDAKYVEGWANSFSADAIAIMNGISVVIVPSEPVDSFTWDMLTAQCRAYSITVYTEDAPVLLGDVNGDGQVNNRDIGLLQRYLNEWDVDVILPATDMNSDGRANNRDLALLWEFLLQ